MQLSQSERASRKRPAPLSSRLNPDERAALEKVADGVSLSRYVKGRIFNKNSSLKPLGRAQPIRDHFALAQVLSDARRGAGGG